MTKIALGVIGTGLAARELHGPVLREMKAQFEIVALCNPTPEKAQAFAAEMGIAPAIHTDYRELLTRNDVEAVAIAVPIRLNGALAEAALAHGKHVFLEKPIAEHVLDAQHLVDTARRTKRLLLVGENYRYQEQFHTARRLVQEGRIGAPKVYRLNDMHYTYPSGKYAQTAWRKKGEHHGGYLIDGGPHIVAGMRVMVGGEVTLVHGLTASFNPQLSGQQPDTLVLQLTFSNGMVGQIALGYAAIDQEARHPKIYGSEGTLTLFPDHIEVWPVAQDKPGETIPLGNPSPGFREEWEDFYSALANGTPLKSTAEDALVDLQIIDAGLRSAASGETVRL